MGLSSQSRGIKQTTPHNDIYLESTLRKCDRFSLLLWLNQLRLGSRVLPRHLSYTVEKN